ncbi:N-acetyltransferase [Bordetella genomosp. 9]|uniref:N-acetyltransferase n=1 Tax=Bordetella genomosp. 9 TaxID=1416803 RepID=UPI001E3749F1|nr:N-acetyltransferase [Bordetella genomosp. 9]
MRVDVELQADALRAELDALYGRVRDGGDAFAPVIASLPHPGLVVRRREADGESYVYVEDTRHGRLAGCTVFNRLIEVDRRTDRYVRSPHSRFAPEYQRRGLARYLYVRELDAGWCLVSGARQSRGAHALWHALAAKYPLSYVALRRGPLICLGSEVERTLLDRLGTRMILWGRGWEDDRSRARILSVLPRRTIPGNDVTDARPRGAPFQLEPMRPGTQNP